MGIVFLTSTFAFAKKEEFFVRGELYGGIAFVVCGIALFTWARRRLRDESRSAAQREAVPNHAVVPASARTKHVGVGLILVALILPVFIGVVLLPMPSNVIARRGVISLTMLVSSILIAVDARRLGNIDLLGRRHDSAGVLFLGMCLLWIIVYRFAIFRRRHFGGPNLGIPAILVALFVVVGPILRTAVVPPDLPTYTSLEVSQLLDQMIRGTSVGVSVKSIDGHRELSYDRDAGIRYGQCIVHTIGGDIEVKYLVEWLDREKSQFVLRTLDE